MYSRRVRHFLRHPVNGPSEVKYNAVGAYEAAVKCKTNPKRVSRGRVKFMLCVEGGKVHGARWEAFGDPIVLAVASWCAQKVKGKYVEYLLYTMTVELAAASLEITDPLDVQSGCTTVINALVNSLNNYTDLAKK